MAWRKATIYEFLIPRKERFKANDPAIAGMPRIEKIDFSGNIVISQKPSKTNMIVIHPGDFVISGINVAKGAMAVYQGKEPVKATIHYSSYTVNKDVIELEYLKRFLKSPLFIQLLKEQVPGGIKTEIKPKHLLPLIIDLPALPEQQSILHRFYNTEDEYGQLIGEIKAQKTLLVQYRQAVLQEAIEGKLTADWRVDNLDVEPASELLARIAAEKAELIKQKKIRKQKPLPEITDDDIPFDIPDTWQWCRLVDITSLITDGKHGDCNNQEGSGYYFLSAKDVQNNTLLFSNARQIVYNEFAEVHNRTDLEPNDICMVNTGATVGKLALAPNKPETYRSTFQKSVAVIKPVRPIIESFYIELFLRAITEKLLKKSGGSAINNLLLGDMRKWEVPLPPLPEQEEIVRRVEAKFALCDDLEAISSKVEHNAMHLSAVILQEVFDSSEYSSDTELELLYPATEIDNVICGIGLEITKQASKTSSMDQLTAMLLVTHPEWCKPFLTKTDVTVLNKAIKAAPKEMFVSKDQSIGWKECRDYLELRNAIDVSRVDTDQNITKGTEFEAVYAEFTRDMSKVVSLALKALDKMSELRQKLDSANEKQKNIIKLFDLKWQEQKQEMEAA